MEHEWESEAFSLGCRRLGIGTAVIDRARSGCQAARGELAEKLTPMILYTARRAMVDGVDARDVVQEVLLRMETHWASFRGRDEASVKAWVLQILPHAIADLARRARRQRPLTTAGRSRLESIHDLRIEPTSAAPPPEAIACALERITRLRAALKPLPEPLRALLMLRVEDGLSWAEVADRLHLPSEDAGRNRFARALHALAVGMAKLSRRSFSPPGLRRASV